MAGSHWLEKRHLEERLEEARRYGDTQRAEELERQLELLAVSAAMAATAESPTRARGLHVSDRTMRLVITVTVLVFALTVIVTSDDESTRNWAFGTVGTIIGYWFSDRVSEAGP